eukprot:CAMPEP_0198205026 /NCGR_PEP_ID=MMETSP1445-20131203/8506_1 /TAXON_ID=36898 /ORGANISM="Pyramimonas sp., Strain CCMP2087" /LENGTH=410 /DNA_ID=CAMNT_0043877161 /DNA_START=344 /DNA_END=1576 /DNA_ORIENTATION=+
MATNTSDPPNTLLSLDSDAPVGVAPPVIFWKLKKVGGSTMCVLLEEYARTNYLTIATPPEWKLLGSGKSSGDSMADNPSHKHNNQGQIDQTSREADKPSPHGISKTSNSKEEEPAADAKNTFAQWSSLFKQHRPKNPFPMTRSFPTQHHSGRRLRSLSGLPMPDRGSRPRVQTQPAHAHTKSSFENSAHYKNCADFDPATTDVVCCHEISRTDSYTMHSFEQMQKFIQRSGVLQFVTLREPLSLMVALFYEEHKGKDRDKAPEILEGMTWIESFFKHQDYLRWWHPFDNPVGNVEDSLKQLHSAREYNLHVNIFERFDESLVMMLDKLNLTLKEGVTIHAKNHPHVGPDAWPEELREHFLNVSRSKRHDEVYAKALEVFQKQLDAFGTEKMRSRLAKVKAIRDRNIQDED